MSAMREAPEAFDPGDDFDAMAESIKRQTVDLFISMENFAVWNGLGSMRQIECFMAGVTTGLIGVCFTHITPEGRDEMMKVIETYLPQARLNVEGMLPAANHKQEP